MISYEQYENKIKKFAKFRNFMRRFKFLFIALAALVIAAVATLLVLKGSLSGEIKITSSVYGEAYADPEGVSAFLSGVSYEYAREGSDEWSAQKPVKAGKYVVRAVSDKTVGKGYGKETSFEIAPREVQFAIESDSVEYGGVPNRITLELLAGDSLDKNALLFLYDDYAAERTCVDLDESSVKISNGADDRSACYTVIHEKKELEITKRKIDISLKAEEFVYSGSAVSYSKTASDSTEDRLAHGDEIHVGAVALRQSGAGIESAVYAGSYEAVAEDIRIYKVIDGKQIDVTSQYEARSFAVSFTIGRRPVTVQTASAEKEYDGAPLKKSDGFTATGLVAGDSFIVRGSREITNAQTVRNEITAFEITNGDGLDLSGNYTVNWQYGTLTVNKRKITVTSPGHSWVYNGEPQSLSEVAFSDELFEAEALSSPLTTITTVGTSKNAVSFMLKNRATGETEDKANFEITTNWGTLEITRRDIEITISDAEKVYDGYALITSATTNGERKVAVTSGSLGTGDVLGNGTLFELTNVHKENGEVAGVTNLSEYKIFSTSGDDRTECYRINYVRGTLTVTPRHIALLTNSRSFVYDGTAHSDGGCTIYEEGREVSLIAGNALVMQGSAPEFTNVAETKNALANNRCSYVMNTDNYVIDSTEYGTVVIQPRELTVTTNTNTFIYDGEAHSDDGYTTSHAGEGGLIGEDKLITVSRKTVVNTSDSGRNVCSYEVPNENYTIKNPIVYGMLNLAPRPIHVVTDSAEKVYDGTPLSKNNYIDTYYLGSTGAKFAGLLNGDMLALSDSYSITDVKDSGDNRCTFTEPNGNYKIVGYDCGTLTLTPRPIRVVTGSAEKVYDGQPLANDGAPEDTYYTDNEGTRKAGLLNGDMLTPKDRRSITNVNETQEKNNTCSFTEPNTNYTIIGYDYGTLTVTPRHITLLTNSNRFVFDGFAHSDVGYTIYEDGTKIEALIEGNALVLQSAPNFTNVWETKNATQNNNCVYTVDTDNYVIDGTTYGTITILARELSVTTISRTFVYDGEAHSDDGYTTSHLGRVGLIGEDRLTTLTKSSVTNVADTAEKNNVCSYGVPNENYTIIGYVYGTLTVTPRTIRVVTDSDEKVYDGQPLSKNEYIDTYFVDNEGTKHDAGLIGGDTLTLNEPYSITDVKDSGDNRCTFTEPNDNYKIIGYDCGTLTVTPRPIRVVTGSAEKVYDGQPLSNDDAPEDTYYTDKEGARKAGLLNGDALAPKVRHSITNVRETSPNNNTCSFSEPNENYKIIGYDYGTLTVTRKPVEIQASDVTVSYGEEFVYPSGFNNFANADSCGLVGDDMLEIGVQFNLTDFGYKDGDRIPVRWIDDGSGGYTDGYENAVRIVSYDMNNDESWQNYEIVSRKYGTLYVMRRTLDVNMLSAETFYGEALGNSTPSADGNSEIYSVGEVYPAVRNNVTDVYYVDLNGNTHLNKTGLLTGDYLEVTSIRFWDDMLPDTQTEHYVTPKAAGSYYIKPYEIKIHCVDGSVETTLDEPNGDPARSNYVIPSYIAGQLTVLPRPIEVTLNQIETKMFDGVAAEYATGGETVVRGRAEAGKEGLLKKPDALVYGEELYVGVAFDKTPLLAGGYTYSFDAESSKIQADGTEVESGLQNYAITCDTDSFEITKRPVTIKMNDLTAAYGDKYDYFSLTAGIADDVYTVTSELGFVKEGWIYAWSTIDYGCHQKPTVGDYTINGVPVGVNLPTTEETENVIDSYEITVLPGKLTITPKDVNVTTWKRFASYGFDYRSIMAFVNTDLAYDQTMDITFTYFQNGAAVTPKDAGLYDVQLTPVLSVGEDGLKNYNFVYLNGDTDPNEELADGFFAGMLQIQPLAITVTVSPRTVLYGEAIGESFVSCSPSLPYEEELSVSVVCKKDGVVVTPKYAGTYEMAIGELLIGGSAEGMKNYDVSRTDSLKSGTLTIEPREITVRLDSLSLTYGDPVQYASGNDGTNYSITSGTLVYGDMLFITPDFGLGEDVTRPDAGTYAIVLKSHTVLFEGKETVDGYLVKDSYILSVETGSVLTVNRRAITVTLNPIDAPAYYDGKAHNYVAGGETVGGAGMADGEELVVSVKYLYSQSYEGNYEAVEAVAKAGHYQYELDLENSSVRGGGEKGIANYTVTSSARMFSIRPRSVQVTVLQLENSVYGVPVSYPIGAGNYESVATANPVAGGIVAGEEIEILVRFLNTETRTYYDVDSILPVGTYSVVGKPQNESLVIGGTGTETIVTGGEYADARNYYLITYSTTFSVTKRSITVTALDVEADYGEAPTYPMRSANYADVTGDGVAKGEELTIRGVDIRMLTKAPVGEYENAVEISAVRIERDGEDVTANYNVETAGGKLTILQREVTVATATNSFIYDGEAHSEGTFTVTYPKNPAANGLAYDDSGEIAAAYLNNLPSVTEFSETATENVFEIVIKNGNASVMDNYHITYNYGTIEIERRKIYVRTESLEKVYDGTPLVSRDAIDSCYRYSENTKGEQLTGVENVLVRGQRFTFKQVSLTNAETIDNDNLADILNAENVSKAFNYQIVTTYGTLTVHRRIIYVNASDDDKVYDGTPLYSPDGNYTVTFYPNNDKTKTPLTGEENVLVAGHTFVKTTPSQTDVGTANNNPYAGVADGATNVTGNYDIKSETGRLTVTKRPVNYRTFDLTMTYCNGEPSEAPAYLVQMEGEDENMGMLKSEKGQFNYVFRYFDSITDLPVTRFNAGTYKIGLNFINKLGKDNYDFIQIEEGTLTVEKARLTLKPADKRELYTNADQQISMSASDLTVSGLASGDVLSNFSFNRTALKASDNKMSVTVKVIKDTVAVVDAVSRERVTDNYELVIQLGSLGFTVRTLYYEQIVPDTIEKTETGRGLLSYTDGRQTITGDNLYRILSASEIDTAEEREDWVGVGAFNADTYGLLSTDCDELKSAYVPKGVQINSQWVRLSVRNGQTGKEVSNLYNMIPVHRKGTDTSIQVLPVEVGVTLSDKLNQAYIDGLGNGVTLLDGSFITGTEGLLQDNLLEAAVYKDEDGTVCIYLYIYLPRYDTNGEIRLRSDRSTIYHATVIFAAGIDLSTRIVSTANYPTT